MSTDELVQLAIAFTGAFNRRELDVAMDYFAEGAVYEEVSGKRNEGKAQIRQALLPQFRGDFGELVFDVTECFADVDGGRVLLAWTCRKAGKPGGWRGLDVLRVEGGKIREKRTYAKAKTVLIER